jgi:hypothetical protein
MASHRDFEEMFSALSDAGVEFLVIGAHAVMFHSEARYTNHLDIGVRPTRANAERVFAALAAFGAPLADLSVDDLSVPGTVFQIGVAPNRIDITTSIEGVDFARAWPSRVAASYGSAPIARAPGEPACHRPPAGPPRPRATLGRVTTTQSSGAERRDIERSRGEGL